MENASRGKWNSAAAALALLAVNAYVAARLFHIEYLDEMWSIEGAFIGLARYVRRHFGDLHWFPLWYGGVPFPDSYPPVFSFLGAAVAALARVSEARAYHLVVAVFYVLGPVALFWTLRRIGVSRGSSFLAALFYSLISPSCLMVRDIRLDSSGWLGPRRLINLVHYGEGPHIAALVLLTLAIGLLHLALEKRRPVYSVAAALTLAAVVLTNWIGGFALALAVIAYLLSGFGNWRSVWPRVAALAALAYALALPWITPATIKVIAANSPIAAQFVDYPARRWIIAGLAAGLLLLAWAIRKIAPPLRLGVLFFYSTAAITLFHYWIGRDLLPQPSRYHLDMDLAVCFLAGALLDPLLQPRRLSRWRPLLIGALAFSCLPVLILDKNFAHRAIRPIDIRSTAEYQVATWLNTNLPEARVFAPGSINFWMPAFSSTATLDGGFNNGIRNPLIWGVLYQIYNGDSTGSTVAWLKIFGCDAIVGNDPTSREFFHATVHPDKLHALPELWRQGTEVIYAVPRRDHSLAHAMTAADLPPRAPVNYYVEPPARYIAALDDPAAPPAKFSWRGSSAAAIETNLNPDQILSIQISWDQGWHAHVNGQPRPIHSDKLGQIVVEPHCNGPCTVDLSYDGGIEMRVARVTSYAALAGCLVWIFAFRRRAKQSRL